MWTRWKEETQEDAFGTLKNIFVIFAVTTLEWKRNGKIILQLTREIQRETMELCTMFAQKIFSTGMITQEPNNTSGRITIYCTLFANDSIFPVDSGVIQKAF